MKLFRHGDVLLKEVSKKTVKGEKLDHLVLAEGEVTGHSHRITEGNAALYRNGEQTFLRVVSKCGLLTHEEHHQLEIPQGDYEVIIQREYTPDGWRAVAD